MRKVNWLSYNIRYKSQDWFNHHAYNYGIFWYLLCECVDGRTSEWNIWKKNHLFGLIIHTIKKNSMYLCWLRLCYLKTGVEFSFYFIHLFSNLFMNFLFIFLIFKLFLILFINDQIKIHSQLIISLFDFSLQFELFIW